MDIKPDPAECRAQGVCANCCCEFDPKNGCAAVKRFLHQGVQKGKRTEVSVAMWKALLEIYDFKSLGIWRRGGCKLELDKDLTLCQVCGLAVAKIYGNMKTFLGLNNENSYIHSVISEFSQDFVKLINDTEEFGSADEMGRPKPYQSEHNQEKRTITTLRPAAPKKFVYESSSMRERSEEEFVDPDPNISQIDDEFDPHGPGDEFENPLEKITEELFTIDFDPTTINTKEFQLKEYLCQICATGFDKASNLKRHLLLTHEIGDRTKDYVCTTCGKAFFFQYLLKNHERCHSEERSAVCDLCSAAFKSNDSLLHHKRDVHRGEEDPDLFCKYCDRKFRQRRCLNEHVVMIHRIGRGKKLVPCSNSCGAMFKRKKSMLGHLRNKQCRQPGGLGDKEPKGSGAKAKGSQFACPFKCGSRFKSRPGLRNHVKVRCMRNPESLFKIQTRERASARLERRKLEEKRALENKIAEMQMESSFEDCDAGEEEGEEEQPTETHLDLKHAILPDSDIEAAGLALESQETQLVQQVEFVQGTPDGVGCYLYEVHELPPGVHVQTMDTDGIHDEGLIQTIHFEEAYQDQGPEEIP